MRQLLNRALTCFVSDLLKALIHSFSLLVAACGTAVIEGVVGMPALVAFGQALVAVGLHDWLFFLRD